MCLQPAASRKMRMGEISSTYDNNIQNLFAYVNVESSRAVIGDKACHPERSEG